MTRRAGFTLTELVLVIVLTLILTAGAVKGLAGIGAWRSAAGVQRVRADLTYARNEALLSTRRTLCVFDLGNDEYAIRQEAAPGTGVLVTTVLDHPLTDDPWVVVLGDLAIGLKIDSIPGLTPTELGFDSNGLPIDNTGSRVTADTDVNFNNGMTVRIIGGSGLAEVQ